MSLTSTINDEAGAEDNSFYPPALMMKQDTERLPSACEVCFCLIPNFLTDRWEHWDSESILSFSIQELETSSQICQICAVIKDGIAIIRDRSAKTQPTKSQRDEAFIIVRQSVPVEVKILGEEEDEEEDGDANSERIQIFSKEECLGSKSGNQNLAVFGTSKDIAPSIFSESHTTLIQSWISHCLQTHGTCSRKSETVLPTRLLDISPRLDLSITLLETKSLGLSSGSLQYATLSHCWGVKQLIRTTKSTISFTTGIPFSDLPRTFQDAICIARCLGIMYIWIDSLCIIQDSPEDWSHESAIMASVYTNSYLNIAATGSGDSSEPFLRYRDPNCGSFSIPNRSPMARKAGEESGTFVRTSLERVHKLYSTPSLFVNWSFVAKGIPESPLLSRAWVFQERYLAPRTLHFHPSELVMECRQGLRCECTALDSFLTNPLRDFDEMSFTSWYSVVMEFSRLRLSFQKDRLAALTGVAKVYWQRLCCQYLNGLWEGDLSKGLLWNVTRYDIFDPTAHRARRQDKGVAPSWSWANLILSAGNNIFFLAGEDDIFRTDTRFELLDTDPPRGSSDPEFSIGPAAIMVKSAFVDAIACNIYGAEKDAILIFQGDLEDAVLISYFAWNVDTPTRCSEPSAEACWDVSCLLLMSSEEKDQETHQISIWNHILVVTACPEDPDAWERVGAINLRQDNGIFEVASAKIFKLV